MLRRVAEILEKGIGDKRAFDLSAEAAQLAELLTEQYVKMRTPARTVACRPGCSWCCYQLVEVTAPEVFRIVLLLVTQLRNQLPVVQARITELDDVVRGRNAVHRLELHRPCALLWEDKCLIHPARPLLCRGYSAFDAEQCKAMLKAHSTTKPVLDAVNYHVCHGLFGGLKYGADRAGLHGDILELTAALRIALETPKAYTLWLSGENVFAEAVVGN